jgi:hypothetical protein
MKMKPVTRSMPKAVIPGAIGTIVVDGSIIEADPELNEEWLRIDEEAADISRRKYREKLNELLLLHALTP